MSKTKIFLLLFIGIFVYWWIASAPPKDFRIGPKHNIGPVPPPILDVESDYDIIAEEIKNEMPTIPGHDDVIFQDSSHMSFLSGMDGWIWKVDQSSQIAEQLARVPLIPTGMQVDPSDHNRIYFCASKMGGQDHPKNETVGLYLLDLISNEIEPVVLRMPKFESNPAETTFSPGSRPSLIVSEMNDDNSRDFCLCNDIAISKDGSRISDISVVSPVEDRLYLPVFNMDLQGLHSIPNPLLDK